MRQLLIAILMAVTSTAAFALSAEERRDLLDSIRPEAARRAGQQVRFRIDSLNQAGDWAVIVGSLMAQEGKTMDWEKAQDWDPSLDKILWVVAKKDARGWAAKEMYICSPEPPYWDLDPKVAFARPCELYAGFRSTAPKPRSSSAERTSQRSIELHGDA